MITVSKLMPKGAGLASVLVKRAHTLELDWDVRQKSRFDGTDSSGRQLGVFLPHCAAHGSAFDLTRAAYHLGNRHVPIELKPDHLKIEPDHVLAEMLRAMYLIVHEVNESFEPENGAYSSHSSGSHGHDHAHSHDDSHSHTHEPAKPKLSAIPIASAHVHGPHCHHDH
jgi:urease accessory protein